MVIAVDFDGTIVEHRYPQIGKELPFAIAALKKLQAERHLLILWTVREGWSSTPSTPTTPTSFPKGSRAGHVAR